MATAIVYMGVVAAKSVDGHTIPVFEGDTFQAWDDATISTSTQTSISAPVTAGGDHVVARIRANGGNIRFEVGAAPTANASTSKLIVDGDSIDISLNAGDVVAVIDAA